MPKAFHLQLKTVLLNRTELCQKPIFLRPVLSRELSFIPQDGALLNHRRTFVARKARRRPGFDRRFLASPHPRHVVLLRKLDLLHDVILAAARPPDHPV